MPIFIRACRTWWPAARARAQALGDHHAAVLESTVDASIRPGDDFLAYANGSWLKATDIPTGGERWNARDEIDDTTRRRVMQLRDVARGAPPGSTAHKVADFRAALLNEASIEARGLAPLTPYLDSIDGKLTQTETVADLGGLAAAVDAYRHTLRSRAADKDYVRQNDWEFLIAFAQRWRSKISESALRTQAATTDHAPESYRISTVRNFDAWYDAFDGRAGERLYLEPSARVRIW